MAAVTVATVAKKVVEVLASNKKGRKFIGYVIGISVFILCIPIIVVFCVFGWTGGTTSEQFDPRAALAGAVHGVYRRYLVPYEHRPHRFRTWQLCRYHA